jgi:hypothetical protein
MTTMPKVKVVFLLVLSIWLVSQLFTTQATARAVWLQQETVTPTPNSGIPILGVIATIKTGDQDFINVRSGPGVEYSLLGQLLAGQQVPAIGRSAGGDWVQIAFPGAPSGVAWVYAWLVMLSGELPIVEPPPTPTPLTTPTIDPTLAAQFIVEIPATRLPTYTPASPLVLPTYAPSSYPQVSVGAPFIYMMIGLVIIGLVGMLLSFLRVR